MRLIVLCIFLAGCVSANVQVTYDQQGKPAGCSATYNALWHETDASSFQVCGGSADTTGSKTSANAPSLGELLEMHATAAKAGLKLVAK